MRILQIAVCLVLAVSSCSINNKSGLVLKGHIKDEKAGTSVYLEEVTYTDRHPMDTAKIDDKGDFSLKATIANPGLYQVRTEGGKAFFFVLDEKPAEVKVNGDSSSIKNFTYEVSGSPASEQLRKFIVETKKYGEAFGLAMGEYQKMVNDSTPDSIRRVYAERVNMADSNFRTYARQYVDTVKNPIIAIFAITNLDFKNDHASFTKLGEQVRNYYADLPFAKSFLTMLSQEEAAAAGQNPGAPQFAEGTVLPDIIMNDDEGKPRKLSSLRGKYVLVDFWASWCGPCRAENPNVVTAYQKYHAKGFVIFSVSLDTNHDKWVGAIKKDHLDWPDHVSELKGWQSEICQTFGIRSIPQSFLLDKEGKVIATNLRGAELDQKLSEMLQ